jgi:SAM-dependent methyltransferase
MGQYRVGEFKAPEQEVARLAEQARAIAAQEVAALAAVGLPEKGVGVEVGCGPGFFAEGLKERRPALSLFGLDVDAYVLGEASRRLPVVRADAGGRSLPLAPGQLDFAYSRLFFRHVSDPALVLGAMKELVKPGGCLAAIDSSDLSLILDPVPADFEAIAAGRRTWFTRRGCSADIGHRLFGLFVRAGITDVKARNVVLDTSTIGTEAFAQIALTPFLQAAEPVLDDRPRFEAASRAVERWAANRASFGTITLYVVGGRVPSAG